MGETLKFPTTAQEVEALKNGSADGVRHQEILLPLSMGMSGALMTPFERSMKNLTSLIIWPACFPELTPIGTGNTEAVLDSGDHCSSVRTIINLTQNLTVPWLLYPGVSDEET